MRAIVALVAAGALAAGVVWSSQRGGGSPAAHGPVVAAGRGEVAVTVGGIGHVNTLSGAAQLAVPGSGSAAVGTNSSIAGATTGATGGAASASTGADAVFPDVAGHVRRLLVRVGDQVAAGQAIATLSDDGTFAAAVAQARNDLATARLELAQKRVQDPARGAPPTGAELAAGHQAVLNARDKLRRLVARRCQQTRPRHGSTSPRRSPTCRARARERPMRSPRPSWPSPPPARSSTSSPARPTRPMSRSPSSIWRRRRSTRRRSCVPRRPRVPRPLVPRTRPSRPPSSVCPKPRPRVRRPTLRRPVRSWPRPRASATRSCRRRLRRAWQRSPPRSSVDVAQRKLDALIHPPAATVSAARGDLSRARADLAAVRATRARSGLAAARARRHRRAAQAHAGAGAADAGRRVIGTAGCAQGAGRSGRAAAARRAGERHRSGACAPEGRGGRAARGPHRPVGTSPHRARQRLGHRDQPAHGARCGRGPHHATGSRPGPRPPRGHVGPQRVRRGAHAGRSRRADPRGSARMPSGAGSSVGTSASRGCGAST
jgi:pyruvate/2-oxoglutarate dehydrogenase complex dihydrolipoamide acyltransferase (E2) component